MTLPVNKSERETLKFRNVTPGQTAVAVVNPDGTTISAGGGSTTVYQGGSWNVGISTAMVTVTMGTGLNATDDIVGLGAGTNFIGLATTSIGTIGRYYPSYSSMASGAVGPAYLDVNGNLKVTLGTLLAGEDLSNNFIRVALATSSPTLYAVVNTTAAGQASVVLDTGTKFIGLVTVANQQPLVASSAYIGLATVVNSNQPALVASSAYIGLATVVNANQPALVASSAYIGLASVNIGGTLPALAAGTNFIGLATVTNGNQPALVASSAFVGLVSTASIQGKVSLVAGTAYMGLASVNVGGTLPALTAGSAFIGLATTVIGQAMVTVTLGTQLSYVNDSVSIGGSGKTLKIAPFALAATNLSGATTLVSSSSVKYYITNIILSNASNVGINFLNGPTYLTGNASLRMQLPAQGGFVENGSPSSPLYFALANQTNFCIVTDTAAPVSGRVTWYEE